jgi:hypothetical protein
MSEGTQGSAERIRSVGRRLRPVGIGGLVAVVMVVLVMGTASAAPAIAVATKTTYAAPYTGNGFGGFGNYAQGCGTTAAVSALPFFNTTSGVGTAAAKVTSSNCGSIPSNRSVEVTTEYVSPSLTWTGGTLNVTSNWVLDFSAKLAASGTTSHPAMAIFEVLVQGSLYDETNGTTVKLATNLAAFDQIASGSYAHTFAKLAQKLSLVTTLKKGQTYEFDLSIFSLMDTSVAPGGTSASAAVTMSGGSFGATLKSVIVA